MRKREGAATALQSFAIRPCNQERLSRRGHSESLTLPSAMIQARAACIARSFGHWRDR